jgi:hypothetical protein
MRTNMRPIKILATFAVVSVFCGICFAQKPVGDIRISKNPASEVTVTVAGSVARCGVTACRTDVAPGELRPYHATINLGHLSPGKYTINWSFPKLTANYVVSP